MIPEAANTTGGPIPRVDANDGLQELRFPHDRNAIRIDQSGNRYDQKNENFHSPRNQQYASLQGISHGGYADLSRGPALQGQGMVQGLGNFHHDVPRDASSA